MPEKASNNPSIAFLTDEIHLVLSLACTFKEELGGVVIVTVLISGGERATLLRRYLRRYIGLSPVNTLYESYRLHRGIMQQLVN
jgi:hypothetical protein